MERSQEDMFRTMTGRLDEAASKMEQMEQTIDSRSKRVVALEAGKDSSTKAPSESSPRMTLVFGGWPRESRRQDILHDLQRALKEAGAETYFDDDPFTTGARRSITLANFWPRAGEESTLVKRRMHNIISAFNRTAPKTSAGARIWTSFSRTPAERRRGAHATWIKKILKALNVDEAHAAVDVEHLTGSSWLGGTKVSGTSLCRRRKGRDIGFMWEAYPGNLGCQLPKSSRQSRTPNADLCTRARTR